jgi:hypothetical protein
MTTEQLLTLIEKGNGFITKEGAEWLEKFIEQHQQDEVVV